MSKPTITLQQQNIYLSQNHTHSTLTCGTLTLDHIQFNTKMFDDALFPRFDIECPDKIKRAVQKRRAEFFYGRLAARFATARYGFSGNISVNEDRSPKWPNALCGSISHCDGEAVAVVLPATKYAGVGVDIERIATGDACSALKNIVVSAEELQKLQQYQKIYFEATLLTLIFSAKESFYKAVYPQVQQFFGFDTLRFLSLNSDKQQMTFTVMRSLNSAIRERLQVVIGFSLLIAGGMLTSCFIKA